MKSSESCCIFNLSVLVWKFLVLAVNKGIALIPVVWIDTSADVLYGNEIVLSSEHLSKNLKQKLNTL